MTTKQILFSAFLLGIISSNALAIKKNSTDKGWDNKLNYIFLVNALLDPNETRLDNIKIIEISEYPDTFFAIETIGKIKQFRGYRYRIKALGCITSNNFILCGDTIVLDSTDPNVCETLLNDYEEFESLSYLFKIKQQCNR